MDAEQFIRDNYMSMTDSEIADELNSTVWIVSKARQNLGLKKGFPKLTWTKAEDTYIKEHLGSKTYKEIGEQIGKTGASVGRRARELGFRKYKESRPWAKEIEKSRAANKKARGNEEIKGLGKYKEPKPWTKKEDDMLRQSAGKLTHREMGVVLNRHRNEISDRIFTLGLSKRRLVEKEIKINKAANKKARESGELKAAKPPASMIRLEDVRDYQLETGKIYKISKGDLLSSSNKRVKYKLICKGNYPDIIHFQSKSGVSYCIQKIDLVTGEVKVERC